VHNLAVAIAMSFTVVSSVGLLAVGTYMLRYRWDVGV